jgi:hypothetical protein
VTDNRLVKQMIANTMNVLDQRIAKLREAARENDDYHVGYLLDSAANAMVDAAGHLRQARRLLDQEGKARGGYDRNATTVNTTRAGDGSGTT